MFITKSKVIVEMVLTSGLCRNIYHENNSLQKKSLSPKACIDPVIATKEKNKFHLEKEFMFSVLW